MTELSIVIRDGGVKLTHEGKRFIHSALEQKWNVVSTTKFCSYGTYRTTTDIHNFFATTIPNTPPVQDTFKYVLGARTRQTRRETLASLLMNDRRNGLPKIWILKRKNKQKETTPRCRNCRNEQQDGELCIPVVGLYVPYKQNFVEETTFYFCPNAKCVKRLPPWVNLTPPTRVTFAS